MKTFSFKCPATETLNGTAYFTVEAETEEEARNKLEKDAPEYYTDFNEETGGVEWDASLGQDWEIL